MGNSLIKHAHLREVRHAVESAIAYGPENAVHRRLLPHSLTITELCELYRVSRKTGYKWIDRYLQHGPAGLEERSRRPRRSPNHTPDVIERAFVQMRAHHPSWGAKKLLTVVQQRHPDWQLPGRSTVCDLLSRNGMVRENVSVAPSAILVNPPRRCSRPTKCGVQTSRDSFALATAFTAIR